MWVGSWHVTNQIPEWLQHPKSAAKSGHQRCKCRIAKRRLYDTGITVTRGSGTKKPYEENSFDCVICVEGEPHMNRREDFFREAFRVVKPEGKLFMADIVTLKVLPDLSYLQQIILKTAAKLWADSSL